MKKKMRKEANGEGKTKSISLYKGQEGDEKAVNEI